MKHKFIRYSIYSMIALLICLCVMAASSANAQRSRVNEIDVLNYCGSIGLGEGGRNSAVTIVRERIIAHIQLLDRDGRAFAQSGEIQVAPAHTNFFDSTGFTGGVTVARAKISV